MELRRFLLIIAAALAIVLIIAVWFSPSNEDFRMENPFWNGTRDIGTSYPVLPMESLSELPDSPQGATLILIPYLNCTTTELEQLNSFVVRGGRLVLADDYGRGNHILEYLGLRARFSGEALLDPLVNYKNKQFPRIFHLEPSPLTSHNESLVFNHATSLANVTTVNTLALSSPFSFLDLNDSGMWEEGEPMGPLPVISHHNLGNGQVILVADPSLFINSMKAVAGNDGLIQNIVAVTATNIYFDQSHLPLSELHQTKSLLAQAHGWLATPPATAGLVTLALILAMRPIWHKKKEDTEET
jgi:uncharacterized membrane protein